jgi:hypothetical protein
MMKQNRISNADETTIQTNEDGVGGVLCSYMVSACGYREVRMIDKEMEARDMQNLSCLSRHLMGIDRHSMRHTRMSRNKTLDKPFGERAYPPQDSRTVEFRRRRLSYPSLGVRNAFKNPRMSLLLRLIYG